MRASRVVVLLMSLCTAGAAQPETAAATIYVYDSVDVKPVPVFLPSPAYPLMAIYAGYEGITTVEVLVSESGYVSTASVARPSGNPCPWLDTAAVVSARRGRFSPGWHHGRCVGVRCRVDYRFWHRYAFCSDVEFEGSSVGGLPVPEAMVAPSLFGAAEPDACCITATVIAIVDTSGHVRVADVVVHAGNAELAHILREAALGSRFTPGRASGKPCSVPVHLWYRISQVTDRPICQMAVFPTE